MSGMRPDSKANSYSREKTIPSFTGLKKGCENQSRKGTRAYPDDDLHCSVALSGGIDGINLCPKSPSTSKTSMFLF